MSEILKKRVKEIIDRESDKLKQGGKTKFSPQWYDRLEKILGSYDAYANKIKEAFGIGDDLYNLIERRIDIGQAQTGDLLTFNYKQSNFMTFVVKNKRTSTGLFTSTKGNRLLSTYRVDHLSMDTLQIILKTLNKYDRIRTSLSYEKQLNGFLSLVGGSDKYRTFDLAFINKPHKVSIVELDPRATE